MTLLNYNNESGISVKEVIDKLKYNPKVIYNIFVEGLVQVYKTGIISLSDVLISLCEKCDFGFTYYWAKLILDTDSFDRLNEPYTKFMNKEISRLTHNIYDKDLVLSLCADLGVLPSEIVNKDLYSSVHDNLAIYDKKVKRVINQRIFEKLECEKPSFIEEEGLLGEVPFMDFDPDNPCYSDD